MRIDSKIGFIQGRLSSMIDGKIQCFPWSCWRDEFYLAKENDFHLMEWTLDQDKLYENPLMTQIGREEIKLLMEKTDVSISSLTGDCFMQEPFYKAKKAENANKSINDFVNIINACGELGITYIVMPLVDNGRLEDDKQEALLRKELERLKSKLVKNKVKIVFESDFEPEQLSLFIEKFDSDLFGVNYDIGNSAAFGYDPAQELEAYGQCIMNVHVKDRILHGGTVPLDKGDADFITVFDLLRKNNYKGNYILQTARAENEDHVGVLCKYRDMVKKWI